MNDCLQTLLEQKLVIISRGIRAEILIQAVQACANVGIKLIESTFDHNLANSVTENRQKMLVLKKALGDRVHIGAGTVLTKEEVQAACDAGAEFIVSPGTDEEIVEEARRLGMLAIPGAMTPSEVMRAWRLGADMVKVFPADDLGLHYFQNIRGPLGHIPIMATGGVNPVTIPELLSLGVAAVGTGVTVLRRDLLDREDYSGIADLARMHIDAVRLSCIV